MGASVSVGRKKERKSPAGDAGMGATPAGEEDAGGKSKTLPERGILRTLGFNRTPVPLPHEGSWLEVTVFEAKDLPAADDNGLSVSTDRHRLACRKISVLTVSARVSEPCCAILDISSQTEAPLCRRTHTSKSA
jgi:hypothetical protein